MLPDAGPLDGGPLDGGPACVQNGDPCTDFSLCCDPSAICTGSNGAPGFCQLTVPLPDGGMCVPIGNPCTNTDLCCSAGQCVSDPGGLTATCVQNAMDAGPAPGAG
jgi:hypothetical protein